MNLKRWFQPSFMFQNLKKSRAFIVIFLFLFPLIISLIQITSSRSGIVNLFEGNALVILSMFVLPVILSVLLFSFVYKKKRVDFMMGMPISRKQIFISNTVCGIGVIFLMFLMNIFFLLLFSYFNSQVVLSGALLFDYFIVYFVGFVFIFVTSNLAMSLAGNIITQIVLLLLLLFFIPFCSFFHQEALVSKTRLVELSCRSEQCKKINYEDCAEITGVKNCIQQAASGYYYTELDEYHHYTFSLPVQIVISTSLNLSQSIYEFDSIIKTFVLSILMFIAGIFVFHKRKMEQCETSFVNFHVHSVVKCLTLVPLVLCGFTFSNDFNDFIIILLVLLAYFYLYDLITKRKIHHVFKSFCYFLITIGLCLCYTYGVNYYFKSQERKDLNYIKEELNVSDIKGFHISLQSNDFGMALGYPIEDILFTSKDAIYHLLQYAFRADIDYASMNSYSYTIILNNHKSYLGYIYLDEEEFKSFRSVLKKSKEIKNILNVSKNDILNITYLDRHYTKDEIKPILNTIIDSLSKEVSINSLVNSSFIDVAVYLNHEIVTLSLPISNNVKILEYMMKLNNKHLKEDIKKNSIYYVTISDTDYYIRDSKKILEMIQWISNDLSGVDSSKKCYEITLYISRSNRSFKYITNSEDIFQYFESAEEINEDRGDAFDM